MFRCPACARVWKLKLTNNYALLANKNMNRFDIVKEPIRITGKMATLYGETQDDLVISLATHLKGTGLQLQSKGDHYLECSACKCWSKFEAWLKAWKSPGDFFDGDQLCACGGEMWFDRIPGSNRYALICEDCGWVKPRVVISGHE